MSELNLLIECINTEGEAEAGGVKYIYMDENTVYRFENNRMKKISKSLINKARKAAGSSEDVEPAPSKPKKSKPVKTKKVKQPEPIEEPDSDANCDEEGLLSESEECEPPLPPPKPKKSSLKRVQHTDLPAYSSPNINLDEYYNNKNKMEYMNLEITRLNNKVSKLKQYKAIVNKLTGNEFDIDVGNSVSQSQAEPTHSSSLAREPRNDSLFLY